MRLIRKTEKQTKIDPPLPRCLFGMHQCWKARSRSFHDDDGMVHAALQGQDHLTLSSWLEQMKVLGIMQYLQNVDSYPVPAIDLYLAVHASGRQSDRPWWPSFNLISLAGGARQGSARSVSHSLIHQLCGSEPDGLIHVCSSSIAKRHCCLFPRQDQHKEQLETSTARAIQCTACMQQISWMHQAVP